MNASVPDELRVELLEPPPGTSAEVVTDDWGRLAIRIITDPEESPASWRGNLLFRAYREYTRPPTEDNTAPEPVHTDYGLLPAFPVEFGVRVSIRTMSSFSAPLPMRRQFDGTGQSSPRTKAETAPFRVGGA